jgi:hypothetical protein
MLNDFFFNNIKETIYKFKRLLRPFILHWNNRDLKVGEIVEGCNLHIGILINIDFKQDYLQFQSFFDNKVYSCSIIHCGVRVVPKDEVNHLMYLYNMHGFCAIEYYWNVKCYKEYIKHKNMESVNDKKEE